MPVLEKTYRYKVQRSGRLLGWLRTVTNEFSLAQELNTTASQLNLDIALNPDNVDEPVEPLLDEIGNELLDEQGNILYEERRPDLIGSGNPDALIQNNNSITVYEISDDDPNGVVVFDGYIESWQADFGGNDSVKVRCISNGADMDDYIARTSSADTGFLSPTTTPAPSTYNDWTNPNNAFAEDGVFATVIAGFGLTQGYGGFGFSIPAGSIITGIEVVFKAKTSVVHGGYDVKVRIGKWPSPQDTDNNINLTTSNAEYTLGGSSELFGITWTPADFADSLFFVAFECPSFDGSTLSLDSVKVKVHYTPNTTTAAFSNVDPSSGMLEPVLTNYASQGGDVTYTAPSIDDTGILASYTFILATVLEVLKKVKELAPSDFYYYVDPATQVLFFKQTLTTATHKFTKGKHFASLNLLATVENVRNAAYFSGGDTGGGVNLLKFYTDSASIAAQGRQRLERLSDNRVTLAATADRIANNFLDERSGEVYSTTATILADTYDIDSINPGDTVGFQGFGSFVDSLILQVARLTRKTDRIELTLGVLLKRQSDQIEDLSRNVDELKTVDNPTAPS